MLDEPASSAPSSTGPGRPSAHCCDHAMPPKGSCMETTQSRPARTTGQYCCTKPMSRRTSQWCQTPTARYADMFTSPRWSSTTPPTIFIGPEPSARCRVRTHAYARSAASTWPPTSSAMAASTWFQTSVCSPVVHGIAPEGSCIAAMDAAVSATCAAVSTPSTYGIRASGSAIDLRSGVRGDVGLAEVQHHALADQGVEHLADQAQRAGLLHDLPHQQAVVGPGERVDVVADADRALDPPVRRVQTVGVLLALEVEAGVGELADQLLVGVDPDV